MGVGCAYPAGRDILAVFVGLCMGVVVCRRAEKWWR